MTTDTVRDVLSCADMLHVRCYLPFAWRCGPKSTAPMVITHATLGLMCAQQPQRHDCRVASAPSAHESSLPLAQASQSS